MNTSKLIILQECYCVTTNQSKDQHVRTSHRTTNQLTFFLTQQHSQNIFGVPGFPGLTVINTWSAKTSWRLELIEQHSL